MHLGGNQGEPGWPAHGAGTCGQKESFVDPFMLGVMIISVVIVLLLGSFALLYPLSRQLALLVRKRLNEPSRGGSISREDGEKLATAIQQLAVGMESLNERQDFVERLLEDRHRTPQIKGPDGPS